MTKKTNKKSEIPIEPFDESLNDPLEPLGTVKLQEAVDLADFLNNVGPSSSYIDVYRMKPDGSKPRVTRTSWDVIKGDVEGYLENFGSSRYELVFRDHQNMVRGRKKIEVEAPPAAHSNGKADSFERDLILALIASNKPAPPLDIGSLLAGLGAMQPKIDPVAMFSAMVTAMATMMPKEGQKEDMLEKLPKILEIVKAFTPEGGPKEENLYSVVKDIGTKVVDAIRPGLGSSNGTAQTQLPAAPEPAANVDPETMNAAMLSAQLNYLKSKARQAKDARYFADYILDNDDEPGNNAILTALERGATFEHLCQFDPEIGNDPVLKPWFLTLYETLQSSLSAPADDTASTLDTGGASGNPDNPPLHAEPSPDPDPADRANREPTRRPRSR